jgi:acyl carrier protein
MPGEKEFREQANHGMSRHGWETQIIVEISVESIVSEVAKTMGDLLESAPLSAHDDFFLLGGDSLRAVDLISKLVERFEVPGSDRAAELSSALVIGLFDSATPRTLALIIEKHLS